MELSHHNLYDMYLLLCIQYKTPDDGQKTCLKHVEFYSKNKFEKLVQLIGFIIRILSLSFVWLILLCRKSHMVGIFVVKT